MFNNQETKNLNNWSTFLLCNNVTKNNWLKLIKFDQAKTCIRSKPCRCVNINPNAENLFQKTSARFIKIS